MAYNELGDSSAAWAQQKLLLSLDPDLADKLSSFLSTISGYWKTNKDDTCRIVDEVVKI